MSLTRKSARGRIHQAALRLFAANGSGEVNVSELAQAAGMARGTVYNNIKDPEHLYDEVVMAMVEEMHVEISARMATLTDPAARIAFGLRTFIRRAHEEPDWGRFVLRFAFNDASLQTLINAPPAVDMLHGVQSGRFTITARQLNSALGLVGGAAISAIRLVVDGEKAWREASADAIELVLRAVGVATEEAKQLAQDEPASILEGQA
jgi:AcrR family transcriptional regulator